MGWTPKLAMDLASCEIARLLKVTATAIEPIHFSVPRKSDIFQDDLYPPTFSGQASLSADAWVDGQNAEPKLVSLGPNFVAPKQAQSAFKTVEVESAKSASPKELQEENEKLKKKIANLESEIAKRDAKIASLSGGDDE